MSGALLLDWVLYKFLPDAPLQASSLAHSLGLDSLNTVTPNWPGIAEFVSRLKFIIFGLILVGITLLRPQGLLPSRLRTAELKRGVHDEPENEPIGTTSRSRSSPSRA